MPVSCCGRAVVAHATCTRHQSCRCGTCALNCSPPQCKPTGLTRIMQAPTAFRSPRRWQSAAGCVPPPRIPPLPAAHECRHPGAERGPSCGCQRWQWRSWQQPTRHARRWRDSGGWCTAPSKGAGGGRYRLPAVQLRAHNRPVRETNSVHGEAGCFLQRRACTGACGPALAARRTLREIGCAGCLLITKSCDPKVLGVPGMLRRRAE